MDNIRFFTGVFFLLIGIILIITSFWFWPTAIYGVILTILGILLLADIGKENKIEKIKNTIKYKNVK